MVKCKYKSEIGEVQCEEPALKHSPNGYCIFHEEIKNKDIYTCMKAFYEKIITGETNFEGFILKDVDFSQTGITQIGDEEDTIWFNNAKFYGNFSVNSIKFIGFTSFLGAEFHGDADFGNACFSNEAIFDNVKFFGKSNFLLVDFFKEARFSHATFCEISKYVNVTFKGPAFFSDAKFDKVAVFNDSEFERGGSFNQAKINFALFENTELKNVSFDEVNITNFKFHSAKLKDANLSGAIWNSKWKSPWRKYIFREDVESLKAKKICKECSTIIIDDSEVCDNCGSYFALKDEDFLCPKCDTKNKASSKECSNKNCNAKFSLKTKNNNFSDKNYRANLFKNAEDVYRNIKLNLQKDGDYKTAGEFYLNEMIMRRKRNYYERNIGDWLISNLYSKICGYGERASRVIAASSVIVFFLAFLYYFNQAIIKLEIPSQGVDFFESLYFSFATFTIAGSREYVINQTFQLVTMIETILGGFMISMFILVFGRKMLR
jgi:uncharacterized protein YjbI with pentapeptide repeats